MEVSMSKSSTDDVQANHVALPEGKPSESEWVFLFRPVITGFMFSICRGSHGPKTRFGRPLSKFGRSLLKVPPGGQD